MLIIMHIGYKGNKLFIVCRLLGAIVKLDGLHELTSKSELNLITSILDVRTYF